MLSGNRKGRPGPDKLTRLRTASGTPVSARSERLRPIALPRRLGLARNESNPNGRYHRLPATRIAITIGYLTTMLSSNFRARPIALPRRLGLARNESNPNGR